jgi:L-ascorbate metabolism protein UlaG (beta-lactamase superfamily)
MKVSHPPRSGCPEAVICDFLSAKAAWQALPSKQSDTMIVLYLLAVLIVLFIATTMIVMRSRPFGARATGARLARMQGSPNWKNDQFNNLEHTPQFAEGITMMGAMRDFFLTRNPRKVPPVPLPHVRTDLGNLFRSQNALVWFGHSSYFLLAEGKSFLVDPVLSGHASPFTFSTKAFAGSDIYKAADMPRIDYLLLTHDHWDHLDYKALLELKPKVGHIITSLGNGAHLEHWGFDPKMITELDWWEETGLPDGIRITAAPARHFSGRGFKRNGVLWNAFVLETPKRRLFLGGDSGPGTHFKTIGERWPGGFDLALLECGQYNKNWPYIHMTPEQGVDAAITIGARRLMPVHWGKFSLSLHDWDEPITRSSTEAARRGLPMLHPMIGELVDLDNPETAKKWWMQI